MTNRPAQALLPSPVAAVLGARPMVDGCQWVDGTKTTVHPGCEADTLDTDFLLADAGCHRATVLEM